MSKLHQDIEFRVQIHEGRALFFLFRTFEVILAEVHKRVQSFSILDKYHPSM